MAANSHCSYNSSFESVDPQAYIETQRHRGDDSESETHETSEIEDELTKELMSGFLQNKVENLQQKPLHLRRYDRSFSSTPSTALTRPSPPMPSVDFAAQGSVACVQDDIEETEESDDSDQEFNAVPLLSPTYSTGALPTTAPPTTALPTTTTTTTAPATDSSPIILPEIVARNKRGRPKKQPRTHNLHGLPIRRDANGIEIGYKEEAPSQHTYAWDLDIAISEDDPYFARGCVRRMVFSSDFVPKDEQYSTQSSRFETMADKPKHPTAVDKAYDWNRTRRGMSGSTEETLKDGKLPRHFVLRIGAPNGPNGSPVQIAERLSALVKHYFYTRLAKSHLTLEVEIPYIALAGKSYFDKFIEKIREILEDEKMRDRLTVQLEVESAQHYIDCDPKSFHTPDVDHEAKWEARTADRRYIWALFCNVPMEHGWVPELADMEKAKQIFLKSQKTTEVEQRRHIDDDILKIKDFVAFVRSHGQQKGETAQLGLPPAPTVKRLAAPQATPKQSPQDTVVVHYAPGFCESHQRVRPHGPSSSPPPPTSLSLLGQAPAMGSLKSFGQPEPPTMRYADRRDQFSSVMSFGSTPDQQARNISQMSEHQTRQYHNVMRQEQMRQYQKERAQQRESPLSSIPKTAAYPAPSSSPELGAEPAGSGTAETTPFRLGKRKEDGGLDGHVGKRSK